MRLPFADLMAEVRAPWVVAEGNLLGEALLVPEWLGHADGLEPHDFGLGWHGELFRRLRGNFLDSQRLGLAELAEEMRGVSGVPLKMRADEYMVYLMDEQGMTEWEGGVRARPIGVPYWIPREAPRVRRFAASRRAGLVVDGLARTVPWALEPDMAEEALCGAVADFRGISTSETREVQKSLQGAVARLLEGRAPERLRTGLAGLDRYFDGVDPGELLVLAGSPGAGKTAVATQIALNVTRAGGTVLYASLEMTASELECRVLANLASVPHRAIRRAELTETERAALQAAARRLDAGRFVLEDSGAMTMSRLGARARGLVQEGGVDLVIVDHLQILGSEDKSASEYERVTAATRAAKELAKEHGCVVLLLSQFNRQLRPDEKPELRHLKGSGSIEQDADRIVLLYRDPERLDGRVECEVAKNRHGDVGDFELVANLGVFQITDPAIRVGEMR